MRALANYYLLTKCPGLTPKFFTEPPMSVTMFWQKIQTGYSQLQPLIQAVLLHAEISNTEQVYVGRTPDVEYMTPVSILRQFPQKPGLAQSYWPAVVAQELGEKWSPKIWAVYLQYALEIASTHHSCFFEWLQWEWQLKYIFFAHRMGAAKLPMVWLQDCIPYLPQPEHQQLLGAYIKEPDPMQAELLLDQARWQKIASLCYSYTFETDELVAYALHLLLLQRWWQVAQSREDIFAKVMNG